MELGGFSASAEVMAALWYVTHGNLGMHNSNIKFIGRATSFCIGNAVSRDDLCMGFTWKERLVSRRTLRFPDFSQRMEYQSLALSKIVLCGFNPK